jgi:hypothetical protein
VKPRRVPAREYGLSLLVALLNVLERNLGLSRADLAAELAARETVRDAEAWSDVEPAA